MAYLETYCKNMFYIVHLMKKTCWLKKRDGMKRTALHVTHYFIITYPSADLYL